MDADALLDYCLAKPGAYLDYPFGDGVATARVKAPSMATGRIFAEFFVLRGRDAVTFRADPVAALGWRAMYPGVVVRGWHCPPAHQPYSNTLPLDGGVPDDQLLEMADDAYDVIVAKLPKYRRAELALGRPS